MEYTEKTCPYQYTEKQYLLLKDIDKQLLHIKGAIKEEKKYVTLD